jgi:polyhydroxyalkanoate synthesis regulator phasin
MPGGQRGDGRSIGDVYRALADLMRLIDAIVTDGELSTEEIDFLAQWLEASKAITDVQPASTIHRRIREILSDGVITREERDDLLAELRSHLANASVAPHP